MDLVQLIFCKIFASTKITEALRAGLKSIATPAESSWYQTKPHKMGLKAGLNLDNIQELLAQIEGEDHR